MPTIIEEPNATDLSQDRRSTFAHPLARSILRLAVVLVIAAAISGGWYLARKGFGGRTRARIVEELHRRGVEASIARLRSIHFAGWSRGMSAFSATKTAPTRSRSSAKSCSISITPLFFIISRF